MVVLLTGGAVVLCLLGLLAFVSARGAARGFVLRIPGVGALTPVSGRVVGLACLVIAYHMIAQGYGLTGYRAPWGWVIGVSAVAVVLALWTDGLERSADEHAGGDA